jgi:hypothetical protein
LRIDIVPLLTSGLDWRIVAVELNARDCVLLGASLALQRAWANDAALEALPLEAVGGADEFR